MSGIVPSQRYEPAPDTILVGNAISSGREWFTMGHLANWLNGSAAQHVPGIIVDKTIPNGGTRTLRFRTNARYAAIERRWTFLLRSTTAGASVTINTGAGAVAYLVSSGRDTRLPIEHRQVLSAQASGVAELSVTIISVLGAIEIDSVACADVPRGIIASGLEYAVDTNTLRPRERIFSSATNGESTPGVLSAAFADIRRVGLYQWAVPSEDPVTRTGVYTNLLTLPAPLLAPLLDFSQIASAQANLWWSIYAKVDAGSGDVSLATSQGGATDSVNVTGTSFAWTTPRMIEKISCEDMTTADGRRSAGWEELTIQLRGTGGTLSLATVSVWNEAV